jgi:predicted metal-dependent hydrolase
MRIRPVLKPATSDEPARLIACGDDASFARAVVRGLKAVAAQRLEGRTAVHALSLGQPMPEVFVTDAKARWGSCRQAHAGVRAQIRYNWRLILAPPFVLDYVAAHECAHLIEANHGPNFWALNHQLHARVREARAWLRSHGAELHAAGQ